MGAPHAYLQRDETGALPAEIAGELPTERIALVDLLDRVLAGGVVVTGEITLSVADVDLVVISLHALLSSVGSLMKPPAQEGR